jgi:hypothetical protein
LGKKSLRSLTKPAGKAESIKVRLKLPKKLNLALPSLICGFQLLQNGQNAANIGGSADQFRAIGSCRDLMFRLGRY